MEKPEFPIRVYWKDESEVVFYEDLDALRGGLEFFDWDEAIVTDNQGRLVILELEYCEIRVFELEDQTPSAKHEIDVPYVTPPRGSFSCLLFCLSCITGLAIFYLRHQIQVLPLILVYSGIYLVLWFLNFSIYRKRKTRIDDLGITLGSFWGPPSNIAWGDIIEIRLDHGSVAEILWGIEEDIIAGKTANGKTFKIIFSHFNYFLPPYICASFIERVSSNTVISDGIAQYAKKKNVATQCKIHLPHEKYGRSFSLSIGTLKFLINSLLSKLAFCGC